MIVYQAHNRVSNAFYIGKTVHSIDHRKRQHFVDAGLARNNSMFHKAIRKYGADSFDWHILHNGTSLEDLNESECRWIDLVKSCGHRLYNLRPGGDGGSLPGKANHKYGKPLPDDVKRKVSAGLKEYYKAHPEAKERIAEFMRGRPYPAGAIKKRNENYRANGNPCARRTVCTTTGETFASATDAAKKHGCSVSSVARCCKGKADSVKGLRFAYVEPQRGCNPEQP